MVGCTRNKSGRAIGILLSVVATSGVGATTIVTGAGNDSITLFAAALNAANSAFAEFAGIQQYSFQWDATNGYLFNDLDGNGTADQLVVLVGVDDTSFAVCNIVA